MSLNLLPSQAKFQIEVIKAKTLSRKVLTVFLIIWVILMSVILALGQSGWWLKREKVKYDATMADYLQLSSEIIASQTIKFRAKLLGKVLADRFEYAQAFNVVGNTFDPKIKISDFELKDKRFLLMTVTVNEPNLMNLLESRILEINSGSEAKIKKIVVKTVSYSKLISEWLVTMEVYLK